MTMIRSALHEIHKEVLFGPGTLTTGSSAYKKVVDCERFVVRAAIGATDNTYDLKVRAAQDSSGTGVADLEDLDGNVVKITQMIGTDDNKQVEMEVMTSLLPAGFDHICVTQTVAGTTVGFVELLKFNNGSVPVSQPAALAQQLHFAG